MKRKVWFCVRALGAGAFLVAMMSRSHAAATAPYEAEIRRTSYGIPHVLAKDERGLGFGLGYAYAQDNLCMLAQMVITVNGERSRYFGASASDGPEIDSIGWQVSNVESDFFFKLLNSPEDVMRTAQKQSEESRALAAGYVAGFNHFIAATPPASRPAACRDATWVRPLEVLDLVRLMRRLSAEAGTVTFMRELLSAAPPEAVAERAVPGTPDPFVIDRWNERRSRLGSNGVALGKQATESGRGLLLGNPHFPWYGSLRFYQMHLTIPGKIDVMGAALGGFPVVSIGFNRHVAWTHTVNTSSHFTFYALPMDPKDPTKYVVDGVSKPLVKRTVTVDTDARGGTRSHDFWISEYGPLLALPGKLEWTSKTAYAIRDASLDNTRMADVWYAMGRATSLDDMERAIRSILGIPWVNTIAADERGGTLYTDVTVVPNVSKAKQDACIDEPHRELASQGLFVLRAEKACEWDVDPAAPQPGIYAGSNLPMLRRDDFVQNSNDSAWMTNPAQPLIGYAPIVSGQDAMQGGRTRIGIDQILARLAGRDGLPGNRFTPANLVQIAFSNRSYYGTMLHDDLVKICKDARSAEADGESVDLETACATFAKWDGHANLDSVGYPLAREWIAGLTDLPNIWAVPFSRSDAVGTPRGIKADDAAVVKTVREALAQAVLTLRKNGIDATRPLREVQLVELNGERIPIPGGAPGDIYNVIHGVPSDGAEHVRTGSSYIQIVTFDEQGPQAQAVLTYSQSTDPASPHFADQAPLFSRGAWNKLPYTEEQIRANPDYRSVKISGK